MSNNQTTVEVPLEEALNDFVAVSQPIPAAQMSPAEVAQAQETGVEQLSQALHNLTASSVFRSAVGLSSSTTPQVRRPALTRLATSTIHPDVIKVLPPGMGPPPFEGPGAPEINDFVADCNGIPGPHGCNYTQIEPAEYNMWWLGGSYDYPSYGQNDTPDSYRWEQWREDHCNDETAFIDGGGMVLAGYGTLTACAATGVETLGAGCLAAGIGYLLADITVSHDIAACSQAQYPGPGNWGRSWFGSFTHWVWHWF